MIQQSTLNASAKQLQSELDLPQAGSEDEDETWLAEFAGSQDKAETTAAEAGNTKEATFHPTPKILSVADPDLPRITVPVVRQPPQRRVQLLVMDVICLDPSLRTMMKTLYPSFRNWIGQNTPSVRAITHH